jgi:DNA-binding transcriptional MerR regulator
MRTYSTKSAARLAGISWVTLRRWLAAKKIRPSQAVPFGGRKLYRWTDDDVKELRKYKTDHYRKGRGRKRGKRKS